MTRKRTILALIALMGLYFIGCDDGKISSTAGVTVTRPVPTAMETLQQVQANAPLRQQSTAQDRVIPFRRIRRGTDLSVFTPQVYQSLAPAVSSFFAPASMAPALDNSFAGLDEPPPGSDVIPPDTMGVAGPNHFVSILNSDFGVFSKTGTILTQPVTLDSFWASLGTGIGQPANNPFDPRILYDQQSGRFIASSAGGGRSPSSWILIAVSLTSNPLDNWVKVAIDADLDNNQQQFNNGADFPALGVDNANIYIAANMYDNKIFSTFQYSKVWVIPKSQLLSGQPGSLSWTEFRDPAPIRTDTGEASDTLQPAHTFDAVDAEYFVFEAGSNQFHIASITFPGGTPTWTNLGAATVSPYASASLLPAPQLGTARTIDTGDTRLLNAVYRDGSIWTTHNVGGTGGKVEAAWYQINPSSAPPSVVMQGRINHATRWYYYPSIAVNYNGDVGIGFTGSSPSEFAGAYYTARAVSDPAGTMQSVATLQPGGSSYYKILSGNENRWGDYSATSVDPADDLRFWTVQEYATSSTNTWGTWIGSFALPLPSIPVAPAGLTATPSSDSQVNLAWVDLSSNEKSFVIERKTGASGSYGQIDTVIHNSTAYGDTGLSENTTYFYRVKATNISGDSSFSNENSALTYLAAPIIISATASSSSNINLTWSNQSAIATRVLIERKTGASGAFSQIDNVAATGTTYPDNTVNSGTTYYYRLKATSPSASSLFSAEANTTTPGVPRAGGGGCAIGSNRQPEDDFSPAGTVLILLSPLGVLAWLRRTSVPPRGRPGAP